MLLKTEDISIQLPGRAGSYLNKVITFLSKFFPNDGDIVSIMLFGSHADGQAKSVSDIDLLIVVADSISDTLIRKASQHIEWLEIQEGLSLQPGTSLLSRIYHLVDRQTGMFVSHFLCHRENLVQSEFHKIFQVSKISGLIAPNQLVLHSIYLRGKIIWGENLIHYLKQNRFESSQIVKSYAMNTAQVLGSLILNFFNSNTTKRVLEAIKWSLYSCYVYENGQTSNLKDIVEYYNDQSGPFLQKQLRKLQSLRQKYAHDPVFSFLSPVTIFLIYYTMLKRR